MSPSASVEVRNVFERVARRAAKGEPRDVHVIYARDERERAEHYHRPRAVRVLQRAMKRIKQRVTTNAVLHSQCESKRNQQTLRVLYTCDYYTITI